MRVLIIGGTGLISTPITRLLLERGDDMVLCNRGQTRPRVPEGYELIRADRRDHAAFEERMRTAGRFDCVIDMVCFQPADAESLVRAFDGRADQLIFCSTVDAYNKPADRYPITEEQSRGGVSAYGRDKARCEAILAGAQRAGGPPVTIIRPAHTYGPGGGLIHTLGWSSTYLDRLRRGKPIVVHGDGSSLWVTCHAEDVARAFVAAIGNGRALGRAYHVTGEDPMTWNDYHRGVAAALGEPEPEFVHIPTELLGRAAPDRVAITVENLQFNNVFDNLRARTDLGFRSTISWADGLPGTIQWLQENGRIEDSDLDTFEDELIAAWRRLGDGLVGEMGAHA